MDKNERKNKNKKTNSIILSFIISFYFWGFPRINLISKSVELNFFKNGKEWEKKLEKKNKLKMKKVNKRQIWNEEEKKSRKK